MKVADNAKLTGTNSYPTYRLMSYTPPVAEISCVKNGRAIVVCGFLMKLLKKCILKVYKIMGAVWELPAK